MPIKLLNFLYAAEKINGLLAFQHETRFTAAENEPPYPIKINYFIVMYIIMTAIPLINRGQAV